jgi:hypothetical protein
MKTMKKMFVFFMTVFAVISTSAQFQLKVSGVKWDESYTFDKCNAFKIEFYAKNNELMRIADYKTYYQSNGKNFVVKSVTDVNGNGMETVLDKKMKLPFKLLVQEGMPNFIIMPEVINIQPKRT